MPNSCRTIIRRMLHKGAMTQEEHDKIIHKLDLLERKGKWIAGNSVGCVQCDGCNKNYDWDSQAQYYNFCPNCGADMRGEEMKVGDRIEYLTIGSWYNSGIIKDIDDKSYLVEIDTLGGSPFENSFIALPFYVRILRSNMYTREVKKNDNYGKNRKVANDKYNSANHYHGGTNHKDNHRDMRGEEMSIDEVIFRLSKYKGEEIDIAINILIRYKDDLISRTELLHKLYNLEKFNNTDIPDWVINVIKGEK